MELIKTDFPVTLSDNMPSELHIHHGGCPRANNFSALQGFCTQYAHPRHTGGKTPAEVWLGNDVVYS